MAEDPLEELRKRLYKKGESFQTRLKRPKLTPASPKAPLSWKEEMPHKPRKIFKPSYFLWLAGGTILVMVFIYFVFLFRSSAREIEIKIVAPEKVEGGEVTSWEVNITNRSARALESAELVFEYPEGAKPLDKNVRALRERRFLDKILSGETVKANFEAFLFGAQDEEKVAKVALEYRPQDSNAILEKTAEIQTRIIRAPLGISIDFPPEVRSGQEVEMKLHFTSNAQTLLSGLFIELEHPFGFSFKKSVPAPEEATAGPGTRAAGKIIWRISDLKPGASGSITLRGVIEGEDLEEKSFRIKAGPKGEEGALETYGAAVATFQVRRPFLDVAAKVRGEKEYMAKAGEIVEAEITFKNNLPVLVENATVELFFKGRGLDEGKIRSTDGAYRASSKSILWNFSSAQILRSLEPGQGGKFLATFSFLAPPPLRTSEDKNFSLILEVQIRPGQVPKGFLGTDISSSARAEVRLSSELQVVRRGYYVSSLIPNTGPMPPRVGIETTFTIIWSLANTTNDLDRVMIKASLPAYMNWKNVFLPSGEDISFNEASGEISWKVGEVKAGEGYLRPAREVAFQVGFIPAANQLGSAPELVSKIFASGRDLFTGTAVETEARELDLRLEDDTKVDFNSKKVAP